jgi:hypothetical protein
MELRLSHNGARTWLTCRQRWYWVYVENLKAKRVSQGLMVGKVTHDLLHSLYTGKLSIDDVANLDERVASMYDITHDQAVDIAKEAAGYLIGYMDKYKDDPINVESSEVKIEIPRVEPKTGKEYKLYGIIDAVGRTRDNRLWRLEHKTAARMDTYYLNGLRAGLQGGIYHYLLNETYPEPIVGTIYNMIIKTKIPQYERMPVLMESTLAERSLRTFDGCARGIFEGDIYPDAGSCFSFNRECDFLTLCQAWKGEWNERTLRIKEGFYEPYTKGGEETKQAENAEGEASE